MANLQTALLARLKAATGVSAITNRIAWGSLPQGAALPYVRLNTISDPRPEHLRGYHGARQVRVQADCYASTPAAARALAEAIVAATAAPATVTGIKFGRTKAEGPQDLGEDVPGVGRIENAQIDLIIEHRPA